MALPATRTLRWTARKRNGQASAIRWRSARMHAGTGLVAPR
jgi:hypothetical protein